MARGSAEDGRRGPKVLKVSVSTLGLFAAMAWAGSADAQDYSGRWTSSTMRESVSVESWGPDCGRRPGPNVSPGGAVTISMSGAHLSIRGAHSWRTNACWARSSGMQRRSTSASATSWRTTCASGPNEARPERGTFALRAATPDRLEFRGSWENEWTVAESHCHVVFRGTRVYTRVGASRPDEPAPAEPTERPSTPAPERTPAEPAQRGPACEPGPAARIVLRPRELTLAPGERRCFQARVVDAAGCTLPRTAVAWNLSNPQQLGGILSQDGCFSADGLEASDEGTFVAQASAGELRAEAAIRVQASDLIGITATTLGPEGAADDPATTGRGGEARGVRAVLDDDDDQSALYAALAGISAVALVLAGVALVLWRRQAERKPAARRSRASISPSVAPPAPSPSVVPPSASRPPAPPRPSAPPPTPPPPTPAAPPPAPPSDALAMSGPTAEPPSRPLGGASPGAGPRLTPTSLAAVSLPPDGPMVCPACQQEFDPGAAFCPMDGSKLVSAEAAGPRPGNVCPACLRGFDASVKVCPHDAEELMPQPLFEATRRASSPSTDGTDICKICPTCASRYEVEATFCGRDGSQLVLVN